MKPNPDGLGMEPNLSICQEGSSTAERIVVRMSLQEERIVSFRQRGDKTHERTREISACQGLSLLL